MIRGRERRVLDVVLRDLSVKNSKEATAPGKNLKSTGTPSVSTEVKPLTLTNRNKTMREQSNDAQPGGGCSLCFDPRGQRAIEDKFTVCKRVFFIYIYIYIYNFLVNCSNEHGVA